jgi:hypothetical protein
MGFFEMSKDVFGERCEEAWYSGILGMPGGVWLMTKP